MWYWSIFISSIVEATLLTHWGWVVHRCIVNWTIIGSDYGLSPGWCQAINWTNAGISLMGPLGTNLNEIVIEIHTFSSKNMHWKCRLQNGGYFVSALIWYQDDIMTCTHLNTLRPRPNGRHFPDDIFKRSFLNENVRISINISLNFVPYGPINCKSALVQIMAWRRAGDKPLSEPMMV